MRRPILSLICCLTGLVLGGCPRSVSTVPTVTLPPPSGAVDSGVSREARQLAFAPGHFQYRLVQNTTVQTVTPNDAPRSIISATARVLVEITSDSDSSYDVTISLDSLRMTTEGSIPRGPLVEYVSLGPLLQASVGPQQITIKTRLADSLCAYGQFLVVARELLLPQLPARVSTPLPQSPTDTTRIATCRAGSRIEMLVTRRVRDLGRELVEFAIDGTTELAGTGLLQRDSIIVSGSIRSVGTASFTEGFRLPSFMKSESEGSIVVRLRDSTTVFEQKSTQQMHREPQPPN